MHIIYIYSVIIKYGLCTGAYLGQAVGQQSQQRTASGLPPARGSPPRTPQSLPRTPIHPRARTLLTHDLHG